MPVSPQDARRWADRLELARSLGNRWPLAEFGSRDSLIYLVADGAYSTSIGPHHWGNQLQDKLADGACPGMVRAFSYFSLRSTRFARTGNWRTRCMPRESIFICVTIQRLPTS